MRTAYPSRLPTSRPIPLNRLRPERRGASDQGQGQRDRSGCCSTRLSSGIGNIYADEALWRAQVQGRRMASTLIKPTIARVLGHARDVMTEALGRVARVSTRSMSTSMAPPGTSTDRWPPTGRSGAARCGTPHHARALHEPVVLLLPALPSHPTTADPRAPPRCGVAGGDPGARASAVALTWWRKVTCATYRRM